MKIFVAIKQVGSLDEHFELTDDERGVDAAFLDFALNDCDRFSMEAALQLRDATGGEVVAVALGGDEAVEALRTARAMGVDRVLHVLDDGAVQAAGPLAVARVLAGVARREPADLFLFGAHGSDTAYGATGVATAGYLDIPHVALVTSVEIDRAGESVIVGRELDSGLVQRLEIDLPALLTIQSGLNEPRNVTLRAIRQAGTTAVDEVPLSKLDLTADEVSTEAGAPTVRMFVPEGRNSAEMLTGSPREIAHQVHGIVQMALGR